jgi:hypothetical protein
LLESTYRKCLYYKIDKSGLFVEKEKPIPLVFKDIQLACGYRMEGAFQIFAYRNLNLGDHFQKERHGEAKPSHIYIYSEWDCFAEPRNDGYMKNKINSKKLKCNQNGLACRKEIGTRTKKC